MSQNLLRVVIAEDEALIRLDLKEMLEEEGYSVVAEVGDGESAVERVTALHPDLAILDVKMPILDGISAAERIAAERLAPVVILTAFSQRELVERARDARARWPTWSSRSPRPTWCPRSRWRSAGSTEIRALDLEIDTLRERLEVRSCCSVTRLLQSAYAAQRARGVPLDPEDLHGPPGSPCARSPRPSSRAACRSPPSQRLLKTAKKEPGGPSAVLPSPG